MSCGCECGSLHRPIVAPPISVQAVIPAAAIVAGWDAANLSASPVALWPDASGNGFDLTQAVALSQPTWGAATGPNGQPAVLFDGVDDRLFNVLLDLPAPATTPTFYWGVYRQVTWTLNDRFYGAGAGNNGMVLRQSAVTPTVEQADNITANGNGAFTVNTYFRVEVLFNNAVTDYIKVGSTATTGTSAGNIDPLATFSMGSDGPGVFFGNIQVCELWIFNTLPTTAQLAALDAYAAARYGAGVLT